VVEVQENIVVEKIIADAKAKAEALLADTAKTSAAQFDAVKAELKEVRAEAVKKATGKALDANKHRLLLSNIDVKRNELNFKSELTGFAFDLAKQDILKLNDKKYLEVIKAIILKNANNGDVIIVSKHDEKRITSTFVAEAAKAGKIKLGYSVVSDFKGGIKIMGKTFDRDFTLDNILAELRKKIETQVADILFNN